MHGQDVHIIPAQSVDDTVALDDQFADVSMVKFGHDSARMGEGGEPLYGR